MKKQTTDQVTAFQQKMLTFFLTKSESVSLSDSLLWLASALESCFASLSLTLSPAESSRSTIRSEDKPTYAPLKESDACFIIKNQTSGRRFFLRSESGLAIPECMPELITQFINQSVRQSGLFAKTKHQRKIHRMTEMFHSLLDQNEVLEKLQASLSAAFQSFRFLLFISQDQDTDRQLPAKELHMEGKDADPFALKVYLSGRMQRKGNTSAYLPIKGQQGTYGVLKAEGMQEAVLSCSHLSEMLLLASAAGKAFENAQLYEQSKKSIANLELINETSRQLNQRLRLTDTMRELAAIMTQTFHAEEVAFFHIDHFEAQNRLPGHTAFFETDCADEYINAVKEKLFEGEKGVFIGNGRALFGEDGYGSLMAVPMIENDAVFGFAILLKKELYAFTFEMYKLFQALIHHATLAVTNSMLRDRLEHLVQTDQLTELYSRTYLDEKIQYSMKINKRGVLILVDIDNFKSINDTYGHQTGDSILIQVASVMKCHIREHDVAARWGGEELAIYLPNVNVASGERIAKRLVRAVRENTEPRVTISCGVSCWTKTEPMPLKMLVQHADEALYTAKRNGKNRLIVHKTAP
ncbi:sensor domain-containing diguanylate cyclase [Bacillus nakamurai]|uniref:sensor domain-containing diguanylate cyclase n=1 Tax=Bacillus nakamurai TaxID=1793963 RepID=UPI001E45279C|nr:sensor domain-containing diguanylate cyclase [Bacillus nakamurai]MCC9021289.1 sensor domain-containing diguanylate cyclase [Bacillus nakamurai]